MRSPAPARPMNVFAAAAERHAEARDLGQAARDQRGARVVAEPQPVADAGRDRHHVLHRAADLHADRGRRRVDAQRAAVQQRAALRAKRGSRRRERQRAGRPRATSSAKIGPESAPQRAPTLCGRGDLVRQGAGALGSKPLHSQTNGVPREHLQRVAQSGHRRRDEHEARASRARRGVRGHRERRRAARPREGSAVAPLGARSRSACAGSRAQRLTVCRCASAAASAVPQAPAPRTASRVTLAPQTAARAHEAAGAVGVAHPQPAAAARPRPAPAPRSAPR